MEIRLTTLGISSASPTTDRYPSVHVLEICGRLLLLDCGECCQMLLKRHRIPMMRISAIFISHQHGDHYFGLFGLLSSMSLAGRTAPLHIYGPSSLAEVVEFYNRKMNDRNTFETVFTATDENIGHTEGKFPLVRIFEDEKMEIFAFPLKHRIPVCGFLFREKPGQPNVRKEAIAEYGLSVSEILQLKSGRDVFRDEGTMKLSVADATYPPSKLLSFAYCSDTAYLPDLAGILSGVDLIYHEATFADEHAALAVEMFHSTARQAATVAAEAGAGKLVIGHFSSRYRDLERLLSEARSVFRNTFLASEGGTFSVVRQPKM